MNATQLARPLTMALALTAAPAGAQSIDMELELRRLSLDPGEYPRIVGKTLIHSVNKLERPRFLSTEKD